MALAGLVSYISDSSEDEGGAPKALAPVESAPLSSLPPELPGNEAAPTSLFRNRAPSTDCSEVPKLNISDDDEPYRHRKNSLPKTSSSKTPNPLAETSLKLDPMPIIPLQFSEIIERAKVVSVDRESLKVQDGAISDLLPQPKSGAVHETELQSLQRGKRRKKGKKKIFALELEDYEEEKTPKSKKILQSSGKSGLFSLLPEPKHCTGIGSRINVDLKKSVPNSGKNKSFAGLVPRTIPKKVPANKMEEDEDCLDDFFSFERSEKEQSELQSKAGQIKLEAFKPKEVARTTEPPKYFTSMEAPTMDSLQGGQSEPVLGMNTHVLVEGVEVPEYIPSEFRDLQFNSADIIDVKQVIPSTEDWALKHLDYQSDSKPQSSTKCNVAGQAKRKHQITYLAWQAKEKEAELQNNWASNKMNRFATQNKYGFR